jgi:hypothetical protein
MAIYGTLSDANAYHTARGNAAWTGADAVKAAALERATDYIDGRYRWQLKSGRWQSMFPGERTQGRDQEREWPRTGAEDYDGNAIADDEVPVEVENATYEAALRELVTPGSLSPDFVPSGQVIKEKVGPIEVGYASPQAMPNQLPNRPIIPAIDEIIAPVIIRPAEYPSVRVV